MRSRLKHLIGLFFIGLCFIQPFSCAPEPEETAHQIAVQDSLTADSLMRLEEFKLNAYANAKKKYLDSLKKSRIVKENLRKDSLSELKDQGDENSKRSLLDTSPKKKIRNKVRDTIN